MLKIEENIAPVKYGILALKYCEFCPHKTVFLCMSMGVVLLTHSVVISNEDIPYWKWRN